MICDLNRAFIAALWRLGLLTLAGLTSWTAQAQIQVQTLPQTRIQSVSGSLQGGVEMVKIDFQGPLPAMPAAFSMPSPARIAMDFERVSNGTGQTTFDIHQGRVSQVRLVQSDQRTRLVLSLKQSSTYQLRWQAASLLIMLDAALPADSAPAEAALFSAPVEGVLALLKAIDFQRGEGGRGRIVVDLSSAQVNVDIRQQGKTLRVDFLKTALPEGLQRRLDVTDFGTPVQNITTTQVGDRVSLLIEPQGNWVHSAYQADSQLVVEIKPQALDDAKATQGQGFTGARLSFNFQNIEVRSILQVIAEFSKFNIITSDAVAGSLTMRLQEVPWDQALDIILQAKGLGMRITGNVIWVAPREEITAREKMALETVAALQNLETLRTQSFQLNYAKAVDIAAQLSASGSGFGPGFGLGMGAGMGPGMGTSLGFGSSASMGGAAGAGAGSARILSMRGSALAEARTNQLFVTDIPAKLEQVQQLILKLDVPVRQVLIEARLVEATDSFGKSLGVRLGGGSLNTGKARATLGADYSNAVASSNPGGVPDVSSKFINLPASGHGDYSAASFGVSLFNSAANGFLALEISALEADDKGKVISSPRIVTADQVTALIEQGVELPYQMASSSGATSVAFRKANLKLEVTPQITPEGGIILSLDITKDSVGISTLAGYAINTKHIKTQVLVENGGTVVIGGIYELTEASNDTQVPVLGDLPVVGHLFKSRTKSSSKKELLVFITPKVVAERAIVR
jgi:type IV pilus assembly protein PilQ